MIFFLPTSSEHNTLGPEILHLRSFNFALDVCDTFRLVCLNGEESLSSVQQ